MSAAPQGVDVLARMEVASVFRNDLIEAREAVAELISAARDYADVIDNAYGCTQTTPARLRLRAALSRIGSAK